MKKTTLESFFEWLQRNKMTTIVILKQPQFKNKLRTNTMSTESSYIIMQHR